MSRPRKGQGPPRYVGVDPGQKGFICVVDERCEIVAMWPIPYLEKRVDTAKLSKMFKALMIRNVRFVYLEEQHAFHREGPAGAFTNGDGFGCLRTALAMTGLRHEIIKPEVWKRNAEIPVPNVPKAKLPPKPVLKGTTKKAKAKLAAWKKKCKTITDRRSRAVTAKRKELSCRKAQSLQPGYDFRSSARAKKPHDGKCEAFLLAREAWKLERRANPRSRR